MTLWKIIIFAKILIFFHQKSPLHMAAERGHQDTVNALVLKRADIKDNCGVINAL